jgi:hypothetical protein
MRKRSIDVTGNHELDQAAAEIAVALRDAGYGEHEAYAEAERLRDAIMAGTRGLDSTAAAGTGRIVLALRNRADALEDSTLADGELFADQFRALADEIETGAAS